MIGRRPFDIHTQVSPAASLDRLSRFPIDPQPSPKAHDCDHIPWSTRSGIQTSRATLRAVPELSWTSSLSCADHLRALFRLYKTCCTPIPKSILSYLFRQEY